MDKFSVMDADALRQAMDWYDQVYGWNGMTNGQWMAKVTTERLLAEYAGLFRFFGLPLAEGDRTQTTATIAHDHYARADRIAYELLRRGEWLN